MITIENAILKLNNQEYPLRVSRQFEQELKDSELVIIYGASDDLIEFGGAISDELGAGNGTIKHIYKTGIIGDRDKVDSDEDMELYLKNKQNSKEIKAIWGINDISWQYETEIPHKVFHIVEDDEIYCIGIIFSINDI
jgi:hypothetical protein